MRGGRGGYGSRDARAKADWAPMCEARDADPSLGVCLWAPMIDRFEKSLAIIVHSCPYSAAIMLSSLCAFDLVSSVPLTPGEFYDAVNLALSLVRSVFGLAN